MAVKKEPLKDEYRELRDIIYTFFYYSNKPVGITEINAQFKNSKKTEVAKVLDDLVEKKKIFYKQYGKQKFYCLMQDMEFPIDDPEYTDKVDAEQDQKITDKELRYLLWKRNILMQTLKTLQSECGQLDEEINQRETALGTEDLKRAIEGMQGFIEKNGQIREVKLVSDEEIKKQQNKMTCVKKVLQSRKRLFKDIVSMLCEALNMKKAELLAEAGIEGE